MGSIGSDRGTLRSKRRRLLAIFMSSLLVLSMFNITAFATGGGSVSSADTSQNVSYPVHFDLQNSYVEVADQSLTNTTVNMPAGSNLRFTAYAKEGFADPQVTVSSSAGAVPVERRDNAYTIDSAYIVDDSLSISVVSAASLPNETQSIDGGETQSKETSTFEAVLPLNISDIPSAGSKTISISLLNEEPEILEGVPTIVKPSGETVEARLSVLSQNLEGVILAIPKHPNAQIGLQQGVSGTFIGTVSAAELVADGIAVDEAYEEYFILVSNRSSSGSGDVVQFPRVTFTFNNGTTPKGAIQPIEVYSLDGVADAENEILPGSGIAISATPNLVKQPEEPSTLIKAEVEEISLGKEIKEINDGGISASGTGTALDQRAFTDSTSADYVISYTLPLETTRNGEENGRLTVDGDFLIHDKLDNFRNTGVPTSISVVGPKGEAISTSTPVGGKTGTSWEFTFKAILNANGMVENGNYTVIVTYKKDDYTNKYTQTENLLTGRQLVTNSAWMEYSTQDGSSVNTFESAASVQNAIGYQQLAPDSLELKIQKMIQVKSGEYAYNTARQAMYPEDSEDEAKVVTFTLTPLPGGEGTETLTGLINAGGLATIVGLKPNTSYTLSETQGIENFTPLDNKTVVVGPLVNDKVSITIDEVDYYGVTYNAVNKALYDGTINATVTKQNNTLTSSSLGNYTAAADVVVGLYEDDGLGNLVAKGTTDAQGKVSFENLDPTKSYLIKAITTPSSIVNTLVPNEANVTSGDFDGTTKNANAEIKYTSTYGAIKIAKNFITANGGYAISTSGLTANFRLVDKNAADYPNTFLSISLPANGNQTTAPLYNMVIPAGEYELYETGVVGTNATQYPVEPSAKIDDISVTGGVFDSYNKVLTNASSFGELKIQNFDYGNTGLRSRAFYYEVTYKVGETTYYINQQGQPTTTPTTVRTTSSTVSEIVLNVPAGQTYTITQKTTPAGFELVENSGSTLGSASVSVAANTEALGVTVSGTAPSFTVNGGTQSVGFVNATLPDASGTKVSALASETTLSGARFAIYKFDGSEYKYYGISSATGLSGQLVLSQLSEGEYRLIETTAPAKYAVPAYAKALATKVAAQVSLSLAEAQQAPKVVVNKNSDYASSTTKKTVSIDTTGTLNALDNTTLVPNAPLVFPEIVMVGAGDGGTVKGGQFGLYDESNTLIGKAVSGSSLRFTSDGTATGVEIGLAEGTYTIKQTGLIEDATGFVARPDAVVTIEVDSKGNVTSSEFTAGGNYAHSSTEGAKITFSNVKKPSITIQKLGETNVFEMVEGVAKRVEKPITGAVFTFEDALANQGLVIEEGKYVGLGIATEMISSRGYTSVGGLDPNGIYNVKEISAPDIEGTDLKRQPEANIPQVKFEFATNGEGQITGYRIQGQNEEGDVVDVWIKDSTLTVHNPAEDGYQIEVDKFTLGTNDGNLALDNPSAGGVYDDGVNAKFLVQKEVIVEGTPTWQTVETLTTGTSDAADGKLNVAISSDLTAGTYRIVEIQSGIYSPNIIEAEGSGKKDNSFYEYTGGLPVSVGANLPLSGNWQKLERTVETVLTPEGQEVSGLVWPGTIILGTGGYTDPENPYIATMGNDDERSNGVPWYGDFVVRLHGIKQAFDRDLEADGTVNDMYKGDITSVEFEVYFGWAILNEATGEYELTQDISELSRMSNVVSGSVLDGKGNFITEYVTFKAWDGESGTGDPGDTDPNFDDLVGPENAKPCFVLVELGPVPAHIVKPTDETRTTLLPFDVPEMTPNNDGAYFTIDASDILTNDESATGAAVVKNFEAEGLLQINKFSSVLKNVKAEDREGKELDKGVFNIYQALPVLDSITGDPIPDRYTRGSLQAVIDLSTGNNEAELLKGRYYVREVVSPDNYNRNGWYQYRGGSQEEFIPDDTTILIEVSEQNAESGESEADVLNFFDAPYASLKLANYWDTDQLDSETASYSLTYSGSYGTEFNSYSHLAESGAADAAANVLPFTVSGKNTLTLYNLPDGTYTLKETSIASADAYHKNSKASDPGVRITIKNGEIATEAIAGSPGIEVINQDDLTWREIDNTFDTKGTSEPVKDNVARVDTEKNETNPISSTTVKINHLSKSGLAIKMGYIDEVNITQDNKNTIASASFLIEGTDANSAFSKEVTWTTGTGTANMLTVPLDPGVYKVTQTAVTSTIASTSYSLVENKTAWVQIGISGTLTYLQNNTGDYAKTKVSSETGVPGPLQAVAAATSGTPFFYNKINAGKLVIYKTDGSTKQALSGAAFEVKNQSDVAYPVNTVSGGTHTYNSVPAAQGGSGTAYNVKEITTPSNYYVDGSVVSVAVKPNQLNEVTIENLPFTSINIHKEAQMPSFLDINGQPVGGGTHPVEGLQLNLYKKNGSDEALVATKATDANGNLSFTGLDVGEYRIEEPSTVVVGGVPVPNLSYLDFTKTPLYNEDNTSYHFTVGYTASATNNSKAVSITPSSGVEYDSATNTIDILNQYNDDTLFIPVMKIDADSTENTIIPVEGAVFRLADAQGKALHVADNSAVNYATTNAQGVAYFHFLPSTIKQADNPSETYEGDYYIREINATSAYVISPYLNDYLKLSVFEDDSQTANMLVFENEKSTPKPGLAVQKTTAAVPSVPLTQAGFDAEYIIKPSFTDNQANALPLVNYTVSDKGFVFQDANNAAIEDARLTYKVKEAIVSKTTSAVPGQVIYASLDKGVTWQEVSTTAATFSLNLTGSATDPATSLFEVWYATKSGSLYERIVGEGFVPGDITVKTSFDRFVMTDTTATSNDVAKIINTVQVDAQYPTSQEITGLETLPSARGNATVVLPGLPTMSIDKTLVSNPGEVRRGAEISYRVTLTNKSDKTIVNPAIIEHPKPIEYGTNQSDSSVRVKVVEGKPDLQKVEFSGQAQDLNALQYQSFVWDNGATAAWVFADSLEAGKSISIEFKVTIDSVVMSDSITNTAYGTSVVSYEDLSAGGGYYAKDNPTGALFKPAAVEQLADDYAAISGITGINGGIYIKASLTNDLEKEQVLRPQKQISTDGVHWSNSIDVQPGQSYYYRLQVQWDDVEGGLDLNKISVYDTIPQVGDELNTDWTDELISLLEFSEFKVEGHDDNGDYRGFVEGTDFEVFYFQGALYEDIQGSTTSDATAEKFTSFRIKMADSFLLQPKQVITITYKVDVPSITDPVTDEDNEFSYDDLSINAQKSGNSRFLTEYAIKGGSIEQPLRSNTVAANMDATPHTVSYLYLGVVPTNASPLPASKDYFEGAPVLVAAPATAPGYDFVGWTATAEDFEFGIGPHTSFNMPDEDVEVRGTWVAQGNTPYEVQYYFQNLDGNGYTRGAGDAAGYSGFGQTDSSVTALVSSYAGFTHNPNAAGTLLSSTIKGDGSTVLYVYYDRISYIVSYAYNGAIPLGAPGVPITVSYLYGQSVGVANNPSLEAYTFSGWIANDNGRSEAGSSFTMPARNVQVSGSWNAVPVVPEPGPFTPGSETPTIIPITDTSDDSSESGTGLESTIANNETALSGGGEPWCWVHWYIILGIIVTLGYVAAVIIRRRRFINKLRDYEDEVLNKKEEQQFQDSRQGSSGFSTQGMGA